VYLSGIATTLLTIYALFWAIQFGRAFVNSVYRRRAFWMAVLLVAITLSNIFSFSPTLSSSFLNGLIFYGLLVVILAFVDGVILVTRETDFFHRDVLGWMRTRLFAYIILIASLAAEIVSLQAIPSSQSVPAPGTSTVLLVAFYQFDFVTPVCFTYAAAAVFVGARRTPDLNLKRHARLLGVSLALFVATFVVSTPGTELSFLVSNAFGLVSIYFLYRAVMALSPIGRIIPESVPDAPTALPLVSAGIS